MRLRFVRRLMPVVIAIPLASCRALTTPDSNNNVVITSLLMGSCASTAAPLPGWKGCTASMSLYVSMTVTSGYVSVYFQYPDSGSYYYGDVQTGLQQPGDIVVNLVNDYVPSCPAGYATTVQVYDGPKGNANDRLLKSLKLTVPAGC
jgi:hypothetical protein